MRGRWADLHTIRSLSAAARTRLLLGAVLAYFLVSGVFVAWEGIGRLSEIKGIQSDFLFFYRAGELVVTDDREDMYNVSLLYNRILDPIRGRFSYPPLMAFLHWPLTFLSLPTARVVFLATSGVAALGLAALALHWTRSRLLLVMAAASVVSFSPVYEVLRLGHPSLFFALAGGLALIFLEKRRDGLAAACISILVLKPQLVLAPLGLLLYRNYRSAFVPAMIGVIIVGALPFLIFGVASVFDYVDLLSASRYDAFHLYGRIHAGASLMFNWNGFWGRLLMQDPSPALILPFYLATLFLMAKVWSRGSLRESWLAGMLAVLLAAPHALYYDWVLLLPPAMAVALTSRSMLPGLGLVALHLAVNLSVWQIVPFNRDAALIIAAPAAMLLLAYLAFGPETEEDKVQQESAGLQRGGQLTPA